MNFLKSVKYWAIPISLIIVWVVFYQISGASKKNMVLTEPIFGEPASFDPTAQVDAETFGIMYAMYDTLVQLDNTMAIVPALAEKWDTSDFKTWRFTIRKNVLFHPNSCFKTQNKTKHLTAHDIQFSLNRAIQPGNVGAFVLTDIVKGAADVNAGNTASASGIRAIGDHVLEIVLKKPYLKFLERLATPFLFIVPKEAVDFYGKDFGRYPVGTGAFMFDRIESGQTVFLKKNPVYWKNDENGKQLPYLAGIRYRIFHDPQLALSEFKNGRIDAIEIPAVLAATILKNGKLAAPYQKFKMFETIALDVHYFGFKMDAYPFKDNLALRQALNYAVDKKKITTILLNGLAEPAKGILPPSVYPEHPRNEVYPYNLFLAKQKLADAGYPEGKGLPRLTLSIDNKATTLIVAQYVQSTLKAIGVEVGLKKMDFNTLLGEVAQGTVDFFYLFWEGSDPNAEMFMIQFKSDLLPERGGYNFGRYAEHQADELFDQAVSEIDEQKAVDVWLKLNSVLTSHAPWLFLYHTNRIRLLQPYLIGYDDNALQIRRYIKTRKDH